MKNNCYKKYFILTLMLLISGIIFGVAKNSSAESNSVNIKTNISSHANTGSPRFEYEAGGNSGENINTGNASAKSSVKAIIPKAEDSNIKINAKAEANGKEAEINIDEAGNGNISIEKEVSSDGAAASVSVKTENNECAASAETDICQSGLLEKNNPSSNVTGKIMGIAENIISALSSVFKNIISLFA